MMQRVQILATVGAPIATIQEAMDHARVTNPQDTAVFTAILAAAEELIETLTGRTFRPKQLRLTLDYIPGAGWPWWDGERLGALSSWQYAYLPLARSPQLVTDADGLYPLVMSTYGLNNAVTVFPADQYFVANTDPKQNARVCLNVGSIWPVDLRRFDAIQVDYFAGYADLLDYTDPSAPVAFDPPRSGVPASVRLALLQLTAYLYEHRGEESSSAVAEDSGAMGFLRPYVFREQMLQRGAEGRGRLTLW